MTRSAWQAEAIPDQLPRHPAIDGLRLTEPRSEAAVVRGRAFYGGVCGTAAMTCFFSSFFSFGVITTWQYGWLELLS